MPLKNINIINKLTNRQMLGKFTCESHTRSRTAPIFEQVHHRNMFLLAELLDFDSTDNQFLNHIYMGFTICGQYFISYKENLDCGPNLITLATYELFVWRFVPGKRFSFISKHKIFKLHTGAELSDIVFMQHPTDIYKLYCYAIGNYCTPGMAYLTILTLPIGNSCKFCNSDMLNMEQLSSRGYCLTHGFILHYMFTLSHPIPHFKANINLAYPDHVVINTGHHIHILNISCDKHATLNMIPPQNTRLIEELRQNVQFADAMSEVSEMSDSFSANSIVEAILEDFSDYDFDTGEGTKPFHELNISCEPLNITGRSYHNALVQNIVDPRLKRLQSKDVIFSVPQNSGIQKSEKPKIDRNIAEKAYEFTEENEKCEKLSSFRKKRLADKKYEFSEDNSENIVPFHLLRRERRYLFKSKTIKSPELTSLFLSPRSQGRSPMQSPNSRCGQFSPAGRNIYCPALRNSPHHSKSPISPREYTRKINVYSPSMDSDCSDYDSKLILRQINNFQTESYSKVLPPLGLLIVDSKKDESHKWIKKVVRRYSSGDFENGSLVSGQSRDDYNMPVEIPILVQTLTDQQLDIIPEFKADLVTDTQLIVTQRSFDCEQFVHNRAQKLCTEHELQFLHCEDYDIELIYICPLEGYIICHAVIKIGAVKMMEATAFPKLNLYEAQCLFTWNIVTNAFDLIEPSDDQCRFQLYTASRRAKLDIDIPYVNSRPVLAMDIINGDVSKCALRDYYNHYEIDLGCENGNWVLDSDETASVLSIGDTD